MTGQRLSALAYRTLIQRILNGDLNPGDMLQDTHLCADLGMSRTPVREALARMRNEGLAENSGRFLRVRRIDPDEIAEIFFLRRTLEPVAIRAATDRILPQQIDRLTDEIRALMAQGPGQDEWQWQVDRAVHGTIAVAAGNAAAAKVIHDLHMRTCIFDHRVVPERFRHGCLEHLSMLDALRRGDTDAAAQVMATHLDHARDAIFDHLPDMPAASLDRPPAADCRHGAETGPTLADRAYAKLHDDIATGRIAGDTVLSERALTDTLGLSRTPLRAALSRLEREGLVDRLSNGVMLVRSVTVEQVLQIVQLRSTLESAAAARAAQNGPTKALDHSRAEMQAIADGKPVAFHAFVAVDRAFHQGVADAAGLRLVPAILDQLRNTARRCALPRNADGFPVQARAHLGIAQAIIDQDPKTAAARMKAHFDQSHARLLATFATT